MPASLLLLLALASPGAGRADDVEPPAEPATPLPAEPATPLPAEPATPLPAEPATSSPAVEAPAEPPAIEARAAPKGDLGAAARKRPQARAPWSRGTVAMGVGASATIPAGMTTIAVDVHAGYYVLDGLELGGEVNNTFLLWNTSTTAQLRQAANELPTHVLRVTPTVRYAPLRRQGLALYFLLGLGPSIFTRGGQVSAHWLGATGLLIRLGGRVHLNLAFRFTQPFPVSRCEEAFIEHEAPIPGGALLGYCEFRFGPHLGIVVAL